MYSIRKLQGFIVKKLNEELPSYLSYHGVHHTLEVLRVCDQYLNRLQISGREAFLVRTAALIHDVGISKTYSGHEEASIQFANLCLPDWGYSKTDLDLINGMIMATKIPQKPGNVYDKILCDADLDYLGTDQFYPIGDTLYRELLALKIVHNEKEWDKLQINFLVKHKFHTDFAIRNREPVKMKFVQEILNKWSWKMDDFK